MGGWPLYVLPLLGIVGYLTLLNVAAWLWRRDRLYLWSSAWFLLSTLYMAARLVQLADDRPALVPHLVHAQFVISLLLGLVATVMAAELTGTRPRRAWRLSTVAAVLVAGALVLLVDDGSAPIRVEPALGPPFDGIAPGWLELSVGAVAVVLLVAAIVRLRRARDVARAEHRLLAASLLLGIALGIHDILIFRVGLRSVPVLDVGFAIVGLAYSWIVVRRYLGATAHLEGQIRERTAELVARNRELRHALEDAEAARREIAAQAATLSESEERFRSVFKTSPDSISISRLDGTLVAVNDGFCALSGYSEDQALGRRTIDLALWLDREVRAGVIGAIARGETVLDVAAQFRRPDGRVLDCLVTAKPLVLHGERHTLAVVRDVTAARRAAADRDHLEAQLRQAQKMEAIGRLAGGVAHDFNNLLTSILGNASFALHEVADGSLVQELLQEIEAAGKRAAALTRQLLAFSRKQVVEPRPLSLGDLVVNLRKMLGRILGEDVQLAIDVGDETGHVVADIGQLEQLLVNLVVNSRDALPGGGRIEIRVAEVTLAEPVAARTGDVPPGRWVLLAVRDDGEGMAPDVLERVFEPFFTTKGVGRGTGLGLSTVYGVVEQSQGHIAVDSAPGQGTTFRVYLPWHDGSPDGAAGAPAAAAGGGETILLVEDEPSVREVTRAILVRLGYQVLVAADGRAALRLSRERTQPIDLLLTDVVMPNMDGRELADRLASERPDLRVLFMSGYTPDVTQEHGIADADYPLLGKPFTAEALAEGIRAALRRGAKAPSA